MEDIPDFLRRPLPTAKERKLLRRKYSREAQRKIKNPPRRASKKASLLGAAFGSKIVSR